MGTAPLVGQTIGHTAGPASGKLWTVSQTGDGDFATIADAVAAAGDGDTIRVKTGVYRESLAIARPVHIVGDGNPKSESQDDQTLDFVVITSESKDVITWSAPDGSLSNVGVHCGGELVRGDELKEGGRSCLLLKNGNAEVANCVFAGNANIGVRFMGSQADFRGFITSDAPCGLLIQDKSSVDIENSEIFAQELGYAILVTDDSAATVTGSAIHGTLIASRGLGVVQDNLLDGLILSDGCDALFTRNQITGMIQISSSAPTFTDNTLGIDGSGLIWIKEGGRPILRGNRISGSQRLTDLGGVTLSDGSSATIENNAFIGCQGLALVSSNGANLTVRANTFRGGTGTVILVSDGKGIFEDNEIVENQTNVSVRVMGESNATFKSNRVCNNDGRSFVIHDGARARLEHNTVSGNHGPGIIVAKGAFADLRNNRVTGNKAEGILFLNGGRGDVRNNDVRHNDGQNVGIDDESQRYFDPIALARSNLIVD